ncbi:MAG: C25 family cysteine peptidase [Candidatus Cloacimonetes bacterium]|nr:C25 family cysteine peptidase [Candidatus Cloacimonadota bacterium]
MKIILTLLLVISTITLFSETIAYFAEQQPTLIMDRDGYVKIELSESFINTDPGKPSLPTVSLRFFLPPGKAIDNITIKNLTTNLISNDITIVPISEPLPISYDGEYKFTEPDYDIYNKNFSYPENLITHFETQYFRGHSIGIINFIPFQYNPVQKNLIFISDIEFEYSYLETEESANAHSMNYREIIPELISSVRKIQKQEILQQYPSENTSRNGLNRLVVITAQSFVSSFSEFINFKTKQGYNPLLMTTEQIYTDYNGVDEQDKIRNFIKYCYQNLGTDYVILGGDADPITNIVPCRGFSIEAGSTIDHNIPSDLYYAALDRVGAGGGPDWNTDNDIYWGETNEADYLTEVAVGRICADQTNEFQAALNKQRMYQYSPVNGDLKKAIMVGENLNEDPATWGGTYKDEIRNGGTYNSYTTIGFPPGFTISTLYDRDTDPDWSWNDLKNSMNNGLNLINHLGHSNTNYNMKFVTSYVTNSNLTSNGTNHNYFIIYTQGCYPAAFDNRDSDENYSTEDCIAEAFTTISNGCVAFIGNSRYGWYNPGGTNSSSQYLDRQFFDALFGEYIHNIGFTNNDSKIDGSSQCSSDPWFRWTYYEVNLFGDPTLLIWTDSIGTIYVQHNDQLLTDETTFTVTTNKANALVGLSMNGYHIGSAVTNSSGIAVVNIDNPVTENGTMNVWVTAHNCRIAESTVQVFDYDPDLTVTPTSLGKTLFQNSSTQADIILGNVGHSLSILRFRTEVINSADRNLREKVDTALQIKHNLARNQSEPNSDELAILHEAERNTNPIVPHRTGRETITCYPLSANYNTGSTTSSEKTQTSMINCNGTSEAGWMKFDTSAIPAGSDINSIALHFYVYDTNWPYWSITPLNSNPVTANASALYNDISEEAESGYYNHQNEDSSFSTGWHELVLGGNANSDLFNNLPNGWFAIGIYDRDSGTSYYIRMHGWAEENRPYLVVDYTSNLPQLTSALGGGSFVVNESYSINWNNILSPSQLKIQFSDNGGVSWQDISGTINNTGSYLWNVSSVLTNQGLVRLCSIDETTIFDQSDNFFQITFLSVSPTNDDVAYSTTRTLSTEFFSGELSPASYNAEIAIYSNDPDESPFYVPVSLEVTDNVLSSPEVAISFSEGNVVLSWEAIPAASGYNVYKSATPEGPFVKLNSSLIISTHFNDNTNNQSKSFYRVTAE